MLRTLIATSAMLLSVSLAAIDRAPARLLAGDEEGQVRGGAHYFYDNYSCPGGASNCNGTPCANGTCPVPNVMQQVALSYSECGSSDNGYFGNCTQGPQLCANKFNCSGCIPNDQMVDVCKNSVVGTVKATQVTVMDGTCTNS